jgi:CheY-like chemotaxis protein/nitrogen-specific signal transduction histidine kinase
VSRRVGVGVELYGTAVLDLTAQSEAVREREQLIESERSARAQAHAKDEIIAVVSHELRTPLTPVLAAVTSLEKGKLSQARLREVCDLIRRNVTAEARLIDDLLDVNRLARGKVSLEIAVMDVHAVIRETLAMFTEPARAKSISVSTEVTATRHHVRGDATRLRQVFWNLLGNAFKFTPEGGTVTVYTWNRDENLVVEVEDTGVGIDGSALAKIFDAFEQAPQKERAKSGGLGLGLAIARGIVELHAGRIHAASAGPGRGARFSVELRTVAAPRAIERADNKPPSSRKPKRSRPPPPPPPSPNENQNRGHILLVEDDPDSAEALQFALEAVGFDVTMANTAKAALASELGRFDLVVSDIGLPDMAGHDFLRALHRKRKLKAIALSGYSTESDVRASKEAGFFAHLAKPVGLEELVATIERAMG